MFPLCPACGFLPTPDDWNDPTSVKQDCVVTCLTFFRATLDTNLFEFAYREKIFHPSTCRSVIRRCFGGLGHVADSETAECIRVCYIVDGFVSPKKRREPRATVCDMKLSDMMWLYQSARTRAA